jgi:hypothetical protein
MVIVASDPEPDISRLDRAPAPKSVSDVSVKEDDSVDWLIFPAEAVLSVESLDVYLVHSV